MIKDPEKRKAYHKVYSHRWHATHAIERRKQIKARKETLRRLWLAFKKAQKCYKCGEADHRCLEFHHKKRATKSFTISNAVTNGRSWAALMNEVKKCHVVCANCHRKLHNGNRF